MNEMGVVIVANVAQCIFWTLLFKSCVRPCRSNQLNPSYVYTVFILNFVYFAAGCVVRCSAIRLVDEMKLRLHVSYGW